MNGALDGLDVPLVHGRVRPQVRHAHVVRSVTIFFEFPQCADYDNSDLLYAYKKLLCSFNSFVCNFKGFCTDKVDKL